MKLKEGQHIHYKGTLEDGTELKIPGVVIDGETKELGGREMVKIGVPDSYDVIVMFVELSKIIEQ